MEDAPASTLHKREQVRCQRKETDKRERKKKTKKTRRDRDDERIVYEKVKEKKKIKDTSHSRPGIDAFLTLTASAAAAHIRSEHTHTWCGLLVERIVDPSSKCYSGPTQSALETLIREEAPRGQTAAADVAALCLAHRWMAPWISPGSTERWISDEITNERKYNQSTIQQQQQQRRPSRLSLGAIRTNLGSQTNVSSGQPVNVSTLGACLQLTRADKRATALCGYSLLLFLYRWQGRSREYIYHNAAMSVRNLTDALRWTSYFAVSRDSEGVPTDVYFNSAVAGTKRRDSGPSCDSSAVSDFCCPAPHETETESSKVRGVMEENGLSGTRSSSPEDESGDADTADPNPSSPANQRSSKRGTVDYRLAGSTPRSESQNPSSHASAANRRKVGERLESALEFDAGHGDELRGASVCSSIFQASLGGGGGGALFTPVVQYLSRTGSAAPHRTPSAHNTPIKRPSNAFRPQSSPSDMRREGAGSADSLRGMHTHTHSQSQSHGERASASPAHRPPRSVSSHPTCPGADLPDDSDVAPTVRVRLRHGKEGGANGQSPHKVKKVLLYSRTGSDSGSGSGGRTLYRPAPQRNAGGRGTRSSSLYGSGSAIGAATRAAAAAARAAMITSYVLRERESPLRDREPRTSLPHTADRRRATEVHADVSYSYSASRSPTPTTSSLLSRSSSVVTAAEQAQSEEPQPAPLQKPPLPHTAPAPAPAPKVDPTPAPAPAPAPVEEEDVVVPAAPPPRPPTPPPRRPTATATASPGAVPDAFLLQRAQLLREEGNDCFRRADFTTAIRLYSQALSLDCFNEVILCNRSAAYCGAFNYAAALADAKFAILLAPKHAKAHWRAGKSLFGTPSVGGGELSAETAACHDTAAIQRELDAICVAERYEGHIKVGRWAEAQLCARELLKVFRAGPSTMMSFTVLELLARLPLEPQSVLQQTKTLLEDHIDSPALHFVCAKAIFYCAHDEESTRKVLHELNVEKEQLGLQNNVVQDNIQEFAQRIHQLPSVQARFDATQWRRQLAVERGAPSEQLLRNVQQFIQFRDQGNRAYMLSEWDAAHAAYTKCLQLDPHNRSLLGATHCNRAAVAMQQERWSDALRDCTEALNLQPQNGKAFARRARVYLRYYKDLSEARTEAILSKLLFYINAAVEDLKKAIAYSPASPSVTAYSTSSAAPLKEQLRQAMETRQQLLDSQNRRTSSTSDASRSAAGKGRAEEPQDRAEYTRAGPRAGTSSGFRPTSGASSYFSGYGAGKGRYHSSSSGPSSSAGRGETPEQHLRRLGLSGRPDWKRINKAYRGAALRWHPDKWSGRSEAEQAEAERNFKEINMSYQALKETFASVLAGRLADKKKQLLTRQTDGTKKHRVVYRMSSFDDSFSTFVDHYILLLAARYKAPIHTWTGRSATQMPFSADPASDAWALVAKSVQEVMTSARTQTPAERQQLKHVDVGFFTPRVCRERAMYLQWKIHKAEASRPTKAKKGGGGGAEAEAPPEQGPSSFDVTKHSLKNDVTALFDAVRRNLPSAAVDASSSSGEDADGDVAIVDVDACRGKRAKSDEVSAFHLQASTIVKVAMRSDEEVRRDADMAKARDALLTRIQEMQTEFFTQHRRWVDVPVELLDAPPVMSGPPPTAPAQAEAPTHTHTRDAAPPAEMNSDAAEMMQELKRRIHFNRPARPSAMTDEGIEQMYANSVVPSELEDLPTSLGASHKPPPTGAAAAAAVMPRLPLPRGAPRSPAAAIATSSSSSVHKVTKETAAPAPAGPGRRSRLQIIDDSIHLQHRAGRHPSTPFPTSLLRVTTAYLLSVCVCGMMFGFQHRYLRCRFWGASQAPIDTIHISIYIAPPGVFVFVYWPPNLIRAEASRPLPIPSTCWLQMRDTVPSFKAQLHQQHFEKYYHRPHGAGAEEDREGRWRASPPPLPDSRRTLRPGELPRPFAPVTAATAPRESPLDTRQRHSEWRSARAAFEAAQSSSPVPVADELDVSSLSCGSSQYCATSFDGRAECLTRDGVTINSTLGSSYSLALSQAKELPLPPREPTPSATPTSSRLYAASDGLVHSVLPPQADEGPASPPPPPSPPAPASRRHPYDHPPPVEDEEGPAKTMKVAMDPPSTSRRTAALPRRSTSSGPMHRFPIDSLRPGWGWPSLHHPRPGHRTAPRAVHAVDALVERLSAEISRLFRRDDGGPSEVHIAAACAERGLEYLDDAFLPVLRHITGPPLPPRPDPLDGLELPHPHTDRRIRLAAADLLQRLHAVAEERGGGGGDHGDDSAFQAADATTAGESRWVRRAFAETQRGLQALLPCAAVLCLPAAKLAEALEARAGAEAEAEERLPLLFPRGNASVSPNGLRSGRHLRNGEAIAGLAALAEAPGAVRSIFSSNTAATVRSGVWLLWACPCGLWELVSLDGHLPCVARSGGGSELLGCSYTGGALWPAACEKLLAKLCGSYAQTCAVSAPAAVACFTGGPVEEWSWWRADPAQTLREIDAALRTTIRGAGVVLLRARSDAASAAALASLGLRGGVSYRVLATTGDVADTFTAVGRPPAVTPERVLLRVWHADVAADGSGGSVWADLRIVCRWFTTCHVCYDCRRFHDVRVPVSFRRQAADGPLAPFYVLRVQVQPTSTAMATGQLWIGLHQPQRLHIDAAAGAGDGEDPVEVPLTRSRYGLRLRLVGAAAADGALAPSAAMCLPPYEVLAASYGGAFRWLPVVWIHLELDRPLAGDAETTFYVVAEVDDSPQTTADEEVYFDGEAGSGMALLHTARRPTTPLPPRSGGVAAEAAECAGVVSLLSATRAAFDVSIMAAPPELPAALLLHQLGRVDFERCDEVPAAGLHVQVNGRWVEGLRCELLGATAIPSPALVSSLAGPSHEQYLSIEYSSASYRGIQQGPRPVPVPPPPPFLHPLRAGERRCNALPLLPTRPLTASSLETSTGTPRGTAPRKARAGPPPLGSSSPARSSQAGDHSFSRIPTYRSSLGRSPLPKAPAALQTAPATPATSLRSSSRSERHSQPLLGPAEAASPRPSVRSAASDGAAQTIAQLRVKVRELQQEKEQLLQQAAAVSPGPRRVAAASVPPPRRRSTQPRHVSPPEVAGYHSVCLERELQLRDALAEAREVIAVERDANRQLRRRLAQLQTACDALLLDPAAGPGVWRQLLASDAMDPMWPDGDDDACDTSQTETSDDSSTEEDHHHHHRHSPCEAVCAPETHVSCGTSPIHPSAAAEPAQPRRRAPTPDPVQRRSSSRSPEARTPGRGHPPGAAPAGACLFPASASASLSLSGEDTAGSAAGVRQFANLYDPFRLAVAAVGPVPLPQTQTQTQSQTPTPGPRPSGVRLSDLVRERLAALQRPLEHLSEEAGDGRLRRINVDFGASPKFMEEDDTPAQLGFATGVSTLSLETTYKMFEFIWCAPAEEHRGLDLLLTSQGERMNSPFWQSLWGATGREEVLVDCPALLAMAFQHVMAALQLHPPGATDGEGPLVDPLRHSTVVHDEVQVFLRCTTPSELMRRILEADAGAPPFWRAMRDVVEFLWAAPGGDPVRLHRVGPRRCFAGAAPLPLPAVSLSNTVKRSEAVLQQATAAALSAGLQGVQGKGLAAVLVLAGAVPDPRDSNAGVTAVGLNFCMMPIGQQWWALLQAALDRVLGLAPPAQPSQGITKAGLWQRLAVLCMLDTTSWMYAFPDKAEDAASYQLLARLAEIGLVYPLKGPGEEKCFAVSPHLRHAVEWGSTAPLCATSMLESRSGSDGAVWERLRQEEMDTILTETNYRLFVYSVNPDLLHIVQSFAVQEEVVSEVLACFRITRDSFAAALERGLTGKQIMQFLSSKAHPSMMKRYGGSTPAERDGDALCLPQSFIDQLAMWEKEFHRVTFVPRMVLLRNMAPEQHRALHRLLQDYGESDAVTHEEPGLVVVKEEVYSRLLARYMEAGRSQQGSATAPAAA
eukprot:gene4953-3553_t